MNSELILIGILLIGFMIAVVWAMNFLLNRNDQLNRDLRFHKERNARLEIRFHAEINKRKEVEHERDLYSQYLDDALESVYKREEENEQKFKAGYIAGKEDAENKEDKFLILDGEAINEVS